MSDNPSSSAPAPDATTILQTMQQLNDIEGDLADTAVAVAQASETQPEAGAGADSNPNPVIQSAEAMETVLEQSIPDAPPPSDPVAAAEVTSSTSVVPATTAAPSSTSQEVHEALTDAPPPLDPSAQPIPAPTSAEPATNNDDEIEIEDDSYSAIQVDLSDPTVTEAPPLETNPDATTTSDPSTLPAPSSNGHPEPGAAPATTPTDPAPADTGASTSQAGPLPEGLSASSPSVQSNPAIIADWRREPTNPQIILAIFGWSIQRGEIVDARAWYAILAKDNPTASQPLLDLINLESSLSNFVAVETLFARALKGPSGGITASADVNVWKAYLHYIRRQNLVGTGAADEEAKRRIITEAYEFALKQCGVDREAGEIWGEYIAFIQDAKSKNTWETQAQQDSLRKIYHRAICIPLNNVEALWKGYDAFESSVNKQTSKKFLAERSPAYMTARTALREIRSLTDTLPHPILPPMPTFSDTDRQLVAGWKGYLKWEEGNPLVIAEAETLDERAGYAMRKCLAEMRHFPEMWHYAAQHYLRDGKVETAAEVLRAGVVACPKSILLTFATAEIEEDRKNLPAAHTLFSDLLEHLGQDIDRLTEIIAQEIIVAKGPEIPRPQGEGMDVDGEGPQATYNRLNDERDERGKMVAERRGREVEEVRTAMGVVWVMYMRYARRAEGIKAARAVFGKARKSAHVTWHIFEASALMEYHVNKDSGVAIRIFELGFKLFSEDVDYVVRYLQFLLNVNDDTNARALFERSALKIPAEKSRSLWDTWARYEYMYGDLGAVQKLEQRFAETFPADSPLKRFAQRYTYNGIDQIARRDLGFGGVPRPQPTPHSQPMPPPPQTQQVQPQNQGQSQPPPNAQIAHIMPPPAALAAGSPNIKRPHSPPRPRGSIERSHSPSRGGGAGGGVDFANGNKRYRPNSPPPPRRYDQGPPPPQAMPPAGRRNGYGPPGGGRSPLAMPLGSGGPPYPPASGYPLAGPGPGRAVSGGGPPVMGGYVPPPREGWDRSGVSKAVAWFVGQLPTARSFDGPVFRPDDIMGLFSNIGPDGMRLPVGGPGPGGYGGPIGGPGGYGAEPPRGYGNSGGPPRRY